MEALATASPVVVDINPHLAAAQKTELQHLVGQFSDVFSPGRRGSSSMTFAHRQGLLCDSGPTESQRPVDTLLRREFRRC